MIHHLILIDTSQSSALAAPVDLERKSYAWALYTSGLNPGALILRVIMMSKLTATL
jgi:hypothetical protein